MRVFGRCNFRVVFETSFVSRKAFETYDLAVKTNSDRIVSSAALEVDLAPRRPSSLIAFAMPQTQMDKRYRHTEEFAI
jgi:hypothetical protein